MFTIICDNVFCVGAYVRVLPIGRVYLRILCQSYINNFAALRLNLRVNAATLNLSLPLYLLKLNFENELNDALPFDGDLASMRTFKSNQKG